MGQEKTETNRRNDSQHPYDVPIPKPPAELLDAFLSNLQSKLVTRRLPNGGTTNRQHHRVRGGMRRGSQ